jgi:predicted MFS family arabinose efflux permease
MPPSFQRLAWSNLFAQSAEQLTLAALPMLAVLSLGAGPGDIGMIAAVQALPFLLLSIPLGLLADRTPRKRLMVGSEILRALALLVLVLMTWLDRVSIPLLAGIGFVTAVGTVGFSVAAPSLVPALVGEGDLARANGRLELARSVAYAAGPALAGALMAWLGASTSFVLSAMLSVAAVLSLARITEPARQPVTNRHPWHDLKAGASFVWGHQYLRPMMLTSVAWNIAWFALQAVYVPYAVRALGMTANGVGLTLACYGLGMMLGALSAPRIVARLPFGRAILLGPFFSVLAALVMAATVQLPWPAVAGFSYFLFGFGPIVWAISSTTLRQTVTPNDMMGRVTSINIMVSMGARPLGAALGGFVGEFGSDALSLWLVVVIFTLQGGIIATSRVRTLPTLAAARSTAA